MAASDVVALVNTLASTQDKLDKLEELKILLSSVSPQELRTVVSNVPILLIFECLDTDDKAQLEVCCSVLERLLSVLNSNAILENLHSQFVQWLDQGTVPVQTLCLSQLLRVSEESVELLVTCEDSLVVGVTQQLANASTAAAQMATTILVRIGSVAGGGLQRVYGGAVLAALQTVMGRDDTVRYRVHQMVVDLCQASPEALTAADRCGMLARLVSEMDNQDILIQLNCVEMLSELARSNHGLTYLDNQGVIKRLETLMANTQQSPFGAFLLPGLMKFFGGLARFHPKEVMASFQTFVGLVFGSVGGEGDPSVRGLAIDTVGFIAATPEGKSALEKQGSAMSQCVGHLGSVVRNSPSDLRTRALQAVASLLRLQVSDQTEDLLRMTEAWFNDLCPRPFDVIWGIAKQPFTDLRLAALQVLENLAVLPWGQRLMNDAAGFKEYLFDRGIETSKESREAKFAVVRALSQSPTMRQVFGEAYYVQTMEFVQQGPFFVRAQAEVAFEES